MLLEFDLAGAEWTVTSYLCRDEKRLEIVRSGRSPHIATGSLMFGPPEELVAREHKLAKDIADPLELEAFRREHMPELLKFPRLPRTKTVRQAGKGANFQLDYREGYRAYALVNEMPENEAKSHIDLYRRLAYPGLLRWYEAIDREINDTRTLTNCFNRKVYFSGALNDDLYRQATPFKSQSTVFDITARAMPLMLNDGSADFRPAQLLAQVHDSLLTGYRSRDFAAMARFAIKLGLDYMSPVLDYGEPFTLGVGLKAGLAWGKSKEIKLVRDEGLMARELEQAWCEANEARLKKAA